MQDTIEERFRLSCKIVRSAGTLAKGYFADLASLTIQSKGVQDMASEADVNTENLLRSEIAKHYPADIFLGEESYKDCQLDPTRGTWVVDPIDGTQPFVSGIPSWCISIAYVEDNVTQIGVVYDPVHDELFAAQRGYGATLNGRPIRTTSAQGVGSGLVSMGYSMRVKPEQTLGPMTRLLAANGMFHRGGSGALSLAYVAAGRFIGYYEPHMYAWDALAGLLLACEAGGKAKPFLVDSKSLINGNAVLVAGASVYPDLDAIVSGR